jgi:putative sigma-54 modulation protein
MNIDITGQHMDVTEALKTYIHEKLARLERHFDHMGGAHVVMTVQKERHLIEAKIPIAGEILFANAEATDMYAAIDVLTDKLDRQVKRHKEKLADHHNNEGRKSRLYQ